MRPASLLLAGVALLGVGAANAAPGPQLHLAGMRPLAVAGIGFAPGESVRVVATVRDERFARVRVATAAGRFGAAFRGVSVDRCTSFVVRARGARGSRAMLVSKSLAECPEPVGP